MLLHIYSLVCYNLSCSENVKHVINIILYGSIMLFLLEQDDKGFERKPIRCAHKIIRAVLKHIVNILMLIIHNLDLGRSTSKTSFF